MFSICVVRDSFSGRRNSSVFLLNTKGGYVPVPSPQTCKLSAGVLSTCPYYHPTRPKWGGDVPVVGGCLRCLHAPESRADTWCSNVVAPKCKCLLQQLPVTGALWPVSLLSGPQTVHLLMGGRVGNYVSYFWLVKIFLGFEIEVIV